MKPADLFGLVVSFFMAGMTCGLMLGSVLPPTVATDIKITVAKVCAVGVP